MIRKNSIPTRVFTMPALPPGAARTLQMLQHVNVEPSRLARAIESDGGWTAEVLRQAQSPLWSLSSAPADLGAAIGLLGLRRFHQLVAAAAVAPLLRAPVPGYGMAAGELWEHSVAVAVATREILLEKGLKPCEEAFTAALLHDVGKLVLGSVLESTPEAVEPEAFEEAEIRAAGIDHAEAGAALLEHWKLPYWLVAAVRAHHDPTDSSFLIADLVHVADAICRSAGAGSARPVPRDAAARWSLSRRSLDRILERTLAEIAEMRDPAIAGERR